MHEQITRNEQREAVDRLARFVVRDDLFAKQLPDGRYLLIRQPLTPAILAKHLEGKLTVGIYCLNEENCSRFLVLDADHDEAFQRLISASASLFQEGIHSYLEESRRGGHLWCFFSQPMPGQSVRALASGIVERFDLEVEIYPKQDRIGTGVGSLIRLPFGAHRLSGKRYGFITPDGLPLAPSVREQLRILAAPATVPQEAWARYAVNAPRKAVTVIPAGEQDDLSALKAIPLVEYIGQFIELRERNGTALGLCPFHEDLHPSFAININENYWQCFAGCGGGTIIDFYRLWHSVDVGTAIRDLKEKFNGR